MRISKIVVFTKKDKGSEPEEILQLGEWPGRVFHYRSLPSTNTFLREGLGEPSHFRVYDVIWADFQSEGRGRGEKTWFAPSPRQGQALTFSLAVSFPDEKEAVAVLPLVAAWCWNGIFREGGGETELKWPNDILFRGKKVVGILTETTVSNHRSLVVIGMGINLRFSSEFLYRLEKTTGKQVTSLNFCLPESHPLLDPVTALTGFLEKFQPALRLWQMEGFTPFAEDWKRQSNLLGNRVRVHTLMGDEVVIVEDIGNDGRLWVRSTETGERKKISFGEIDIDR